ncbi:MAG: DUF2065 domain-containing protein [Notoacmeibacter sp.]|nr:DUF2065 domain-containing protein [Notoacmeibacter sp.]MCC0032097.1 DUF2065 domain-containing protein [Brucellaceae bacterium]
MNDFLAALGLMLVFEGILYGAFPGVVRRMAEEMRAMPDSFMRVAGIGAAALGVLVVWLVRG